MRKLKVYWWISITLAILLWIPALFAIVIIGFAPNSAWQNGDSFLPCMAIILAVWLMSIGSGVYLNYKLDEYASISK
jgi:lipopolysaccharide export LptBFGC system permease protein LptF